MDTFTYTAENNNDKDCGNFGDSQTASEKTQISTLTE